MFVRKLLLILAATAGFTAIAQADVLIYKATESNRRIGYDNDRAGTAVGYIVFDWDTGEIRKFSATGAGTGRRFTVSNPGGVRVYVAKGPRKSTYTVITRYQEKSAPYTEVLELMQGKDQPLTIRPGRAVYSPKTLSSSTKEVVIPYSEDDVILWSRSTTAVFQSKETIAANKTGQTVDSLMERYRALYLAKGYYEVPDTE
jgi:hypothetical protein